MQMTHPRIGSTRALGLMAFLVAAWAPTVAAQVAPYVDPPFAGQCTVRHFEEHEVPPIDIPDDPLCVEYEKRDITGTNGGAVRFLAAEPARFALAIPKCQYWQQDHWRIQVAPGDPTILQWDGSYWFDKGAGTGAARLRNFTVAGQAGSPDQVADLIEPVDPEMAAVIRQFGEDSGGGGGSSFELGFTVPSCPGAPGALNHFQCYKLARSTFSPRRAVSLDDQYGAGTVDVRRPVVLCNPADKRDGDPTAPSDPDHLVGYKMKQTTPSFLKRTGQEVVNQFGTVLVDVVRPDRLLVPSAKSLTSQPPQPNPVIDHFKCYRVKRSRFRIDAVKVDDQFGTLTMDLRKPTRLCVAANKNGEGLREPSAHLLCYKARVRSGTAKFPGPRAVYLTNQFGPQSGTAIKPREFCVPSLLNPSQPTPTPATTPTAVATESATPTPALPTATATPGGMAEGPPPSGTWIAGDLHVHTIYSHDVCDPMMPQSEQCQAEPYTTGFTPAEQLALAETRGLGFVALTDHNTIAHLSDPGVSGYQGSLILLPGQELSLQGHANVLGYGGDVQNRRGSSSPADVQAIIAEVHGAGGLFQINHPQESRWRYGRDPGIDEVTGFDSIEFWNIHWDYQDRFIGFLNPSNNPDALRYWQSWLDRGVRVPGTGGSDSHWIALSDIQGVGQPSTWVFVETPSLAGVLQGIRAGRVFVASEPPAFNGARLFLEADADADGVYGTIAGGTLIGSGPKRLRVRVENGSGNDLRIVGNGGAVLATATVTAPSEELRFTLDLPAPSWVRADLFHADPETDMTALSSPIYVSAT